MFIVVKHTSQNIPKEQEQHYPLFYISWASGGRPMGCSSDWAWTTQEPTTWQWKMTRVCPCVWPMFSFFDRFSNTIFEYLWLLAHPRVPFSKPWTTKPYVCATMLNLSVYFKLWTTYQLSYLHKYTSIHPRFAATPWLFIWGVAPRRLLYPLVSNDSQRKPPILS